MSNNMLLILIRIPNIIQIENKKHNRKKKFTAKYTCTRHGDKLPLKVTVVRILLLFKLRKHRCKYFTE